MISRTLKILIALSMIQQGLMFLKVSNVQADETLIQNEHLRVCAVQDSGQYYLKFECKEANGSWRVILSTSAEATPAPWNPKKFFVREDPFVKWKIGDGDILEASAFFSKAESRSNGRQLLLTGQAGPHQIEQQLSLKGKNHLHVTVKDKFSEVGVELGQLLNHYYFKPDDQSFGYAIPLDFSWLPNLNRYEDGICGDHFFRSPAVIVHTYGAYAAIVPDLDLLMEHRTIPHAMDLRIFGTRAETPRLTYGLSTWEIDGHVYTRHDPKHVAPIEGNELIYGYDLFIGLSDTPDDVVKKITSYLWDRYGERYFKNIRPQVLPFEEYGRRYSYVYELKRWANRVVIDGKECYGIKELDNFKRGALFHAWWNDLHVGFGICHYGRKWKDKEMTRIADGIMRLSLSAPDNMGAFPCVYNWDTNKYEGSLFWTSRPADPYNGYDAQAMGVSAWWRLYWYEHFMKEAEILQSVVNYAHFLRNVQLPSGAIPTYYFSDLRPANQLKESATTSISGAVLAKVALMNHDPELKAAAIAAGKFMDERILPKLLFQDFEVFYSCSKKSYHWIDVWSGLPPINNLAIQWTCDQFLALYKLTNDEYWLHRGEYVLSLLSLFQQVWDPPFYEAYLFGGFGVMNTDGEWNDGRQARFIPTYADYYRATGNIEYLERAVSGCRAAFALQDIKENHLNGINLVEMPMGPGQGYAPENCLHGGPRPIRGGGGYTGYNWASGGALGASAYLERLFGAVMIDGQKCMAIPIDGTSVTIKKWKDEKISLEISSAFKDLPHPDKSDRTIVVKFGRLSKLNYDVTINDIEFKNMTREKLAKGLSIHLPEIQ